MGLIPAAMLGGVPVALEVLNSGAFASEDSDVLTRTYGPTSVTWTFSCWVKRSDISSVMKLLGNEIRFNLNDTITAEALATSALFRDVSEFYHICVSTDLWVNGASLGTVTTTAITSSSIGTTLSGYLSEVYFIDGQALTPSDFAEESSITDQWIPIEYTGTYGTEGFYLNFQNGSNLGEDSSGNNNDFTNSGVIQSTDTPTGNHAIFPVTALGLNAVVSKSGLNVSWDGITTPWSAMAATIGVSSGKWYWEIDVVVATACMIGISNVHFNSGDFVGIGQWTGKTTHGWGYFNGNGNTYNDAAAATYGATYAAGDIIGIALDMDTGDIEFFKNNVSQGVAFTGLVDHIFPSIGNATGVSPFECEFGFTEDSWVYSAPSGFVALSTKNFPVPDIAKPEGYFKDLGYDDGTGAKDIGFQPDMVWLKSRGSAFSHKIVDSTRGATKALSPDDSLAEVTESTGLTSFDTDGFTVGADTDYSDQTGDGMVAWSWKEGVTPGFEIIDYVGDGATSRNISHSLGAVPQFMIVRAVDAATTWRIYHEFLSATAPEGSVLRLDTNQAEIVNSEMWDDTLPTSAQFTIGVHASVNANTINFIAYLFTQIEGFSHFGHYIGNGVTEGPFIYCGFRPAFLMIKSVDSIQNWAIKSTAQSPDNVMELTIASDIPDAEVNNTYIDFLSNGFKIRATHARVNVDTERYVYMAFAESPFQYGRAK